MKVVIYEQYYKNLTIEKYYGSPIMVALFRGIKINLILIPSVHFCESYHSNAACNPFRIRYFADLKVAKLSL